MRPRRFAIDLAGALIQPAAPVIQTSLRGQNPRRVGGFAGFACPARNGCRAIASVSGKGDFPRLFAKAQGATHRRVSGCCIQQVTRLGGLPDNERTIYSIDGSLSVKGSLVREHWIGLVRIPHMDYVRPKFEIREHS